MRGGGEGICTSVTKIHVPVQLLRQACPVLCMGCCAQTVVALSAAHATLIARAHPPRREEAAERIRAIEAELAAGASGLDDVQREVLASDLQRLRQQLGQ